MNSIESVKVQHRGQTVVRLCVAVLSLLVLSFVRVVNIEHLSDLDVHSLSLLSFFRAVAQDDRLALMAAGQSRGHLGYCSSEGTGCRTEVHHPHRCHRA